jgi:hypothetical protein
MTPRRLARLLQHEDITVNDVIRFEFKSNIFSATLTEGGVLHKCLWKNPKGLLLTVLKGKTFLSLSDWTESCIQDVLHEFSTRYSSWKRVFHVRSGKSLDEIWKAHTENKLAQVKKPTIDQMRQMNERLLEKLARANEKIETLTSGPSESSDDAVHPIVMNSPTGTYMVLQRMVDTQSPYVDEIKKNGLDDFRNHLAKFSKKSIIEDGSKSSEWFDRLKAGVPKDNMVVAKFVHDFFIRGKRGDAKKRKATSDFDVLQPQEKIMRHSETVSKLES